MTGAGPVVETLGLARPSGDWAVIRSAARQAQVLADALEDAACHIGSPAPGAWEGRAASAFEATARRGRQEVLEAAGSIRRMAEALLPLARAVEDAQDRAGRALQVLVGAEEQRRVLFGRGTYN
ncbi:MAG: putative T7SS-secreted protein, partial [Actinomycetota bacterium]